MKNLDTQILVDALSKQATRIARDCLPEGKLSGHYFFAGWFCQKDCVSSIY
ncbi:MAG: hypothetical protein HRU28_11430 [Rhizobiales bacterium]|nr:hypothetical protein [Hyphomicrobiales bacterium]